MATGAVNAAVGPSWRLLDCQVYINGTRLEDGSGVPALDTEVTVLQGLTIKWGRSTTVDQPAPGSCAFELMDVDGRNGFMALAGVGKRVLVEVANQVNKGNSVRVFSGRITDTHAVWDEAIGGVRVSVVAVDGLGQLGSMQVATQPLPAQQFGVRFNAIAAAALQGAPAAETPFRETRTQYGADVLGTTTRMVAPIDIDRQGGLQALQDLIGGLDLTLWDNPGTTAGYTPAQSSHGLLIQDTVNGRDPLLQLARLPGGFVGIVPADPVDILPPTQAFNITRLDACELLLEPIEWVQDVADVTTRVLVTWTDLAGAGHTATRYSDLDSNASVVGIRSASLDSQVTTAAEADALAARLLTRMAYTGWRITGVTVDLRAPAELTDDLRRRALQLLSGPDRAGRPIQLVNMPDWSPVGGPVGCYLEGGTYTYTDGGWLLSLDVSNSTGIGESAGYSQLDPTWAYTDLSPELTYDSLIGVGP